MELWYLLSAHCLVVLYICTKFVKISRGHSELLNRKLILTKGIIPSNKYTKLWFMFSVHCIVMLSKEHRSNKTAGGVMVLILCILSDGPLYLH